MNEPVDIDPQLPSDGEYTETPSLLQEEKKKKSFNFKAALGDSSSRKTLFIVLGIAVFGVAFAFWPHGHKKIPNSTATSVPQLSTPQGSQVPSQQYSDELQQANNQRAQQALQSGGSALPTMQLPPPTSAPPPDLGQGGYPAQQPPPPILPTTPPPVTPTAATTAPQQGRTYPVYNIQPDQATTQNMVQYMSKLNAGVPIATLVMFPKATGHDAEGSEGAGAGANAAPSAVQPAAALAGSSQDAQEQGPFTAPVVGTVLYSVLVTGADSDAPGPVLGEVEQGALTGARLMGGFTTSSQGMTITFKTLIMPYKDADGAPKTQVIPINAMAVDTSTLTDNVATSVNNHLAERLGVAFVSSLLGNYGQLVSQSGASTVVSSTGSIATSNPTLSTKKQFESAAGQAVGQAGQIFNQVYGNIPTTIKAAPGTAFGLLFLAGDN